MVEIKKPYLTQVCFGLDTPDRDRDLIQSIVEDVGYEVLFYEIQKSNTDFGLKLVSLSKADY